MSKATAEEIKQAIDFAHKLRAQGQDQHHLVKVLLDYHEQLRYLQPVVTATERYLHSGLSEQEHAVLLRAMEAMRQAQAKHTSPSLPPLGLD